MEPCAMVAGRAESLVQIDIAVPHRQRMRPNNHEPKHIYCIPQTLARTLHHLAGSLANDPRSVEAISASDVYKMVLGMTTET